MGVDLLAAAEAVFATRPDLATALVDHVLDESSAAGHRERWLEAAGAIVAMSAAAGDARPTAGRVVAALGRWGTDALSGAAAHRLRVELALLLAGTDASVQVRELVEPVVAGSGPVSPAHRTFAYLALARSAIDTASAEVALTAAARAVTGRADEAEMVAEVALVGAAGARHDGRLDTALGHAEDGLRVLGPVPDRIAGHIGPSLTGAALDHGASVQPRSGSSESGERLRLALTAECVAALLDAGRVGDARARAADGEDLLGMTLRPCRQRALLRLTVATAFAAVRDTSVTIEALIAAAEEAAASDAAELEAVCRSTLGTVYEKAGRLDDALAQFSAGADARRRDQDRDAQLLAAVAAVRQPARGSGSAIVAVHDAAPGSTTGHRTDGAASIDDRVTGHGRNGNSGYGEHRAARNGASGHDAARNGFGDAAATVDGALRHDEDQAPDIHGGMSWLAGAAWGAPAPETAPSVGVAAPPADPPVRDRSLADPPGASRSDDSPRHARPGTDPLAELHTPQATTEEPAAQTLDSDEFDAWMRTALDELDRVWGPITRGAKALPPPAPDAGRSDPLRSDPLRSDAAFERTQPAGPAPLDVVPAARPGPTDLSRSALADLARRVTAAPVRVTPGESLNPAPPTPPVAATRDISGPPPEYQPPDPDVDALGSTVVVDLARDGRRFAGRRAAAVIREVVQLVGEHLPAGSRLRFDDAEVASFVLPGLTGPAAARWMYRTLPALLAEFTAGHDLPGTQIRATVHDLDGPVGAQLLHRVDAGPGARPPVPGTGRRRRADPHDDATEPPAPETGRHERSRAREDDDRDPATVAEPDSSPPGDGLGLADLLAGALAAYRSI